MNVDGSEVKATKKQENTSFKPLCSLVGWKMLD
jgi:hypothetical protein